MFNGKDYSPLPSLAEKFYYFRQHGFVDDPLTEKVKHEKV